MSIYRTNNPLEFAEIDGIIIDEQSPAPSVKGVGTGVCILVGQFERGPLTLQEPGSIQNIQKLYGDSNFDGNLALKNKKFSRIKIIRALAALAVKGTKTFDDGGGTPVDIIKFDAKYKGVYGNKIKVTIAAGSTSGSKYTIEDTNTNGLTTEVYDNVLITAVGTTFSSSLLVDVTVLATSAEPEVVAATALASGAEGTIADTDYEAAIEVAEAENCGNILFLDSYNSIRNGYLKAHAALTQDKMVICAGADSESVADAITAVNSLRDTDGRIIYAYNWLQTLINGVATFVSPASFYASLLSQIGPHIDPAYAGNTGYLFGVLDIKNKLTRADYINLMNAGVSSFEFDQDTGFKVKSGVVTQIANSSKLTVSRRRMADYLSNSIGYFLKVYQNAVNSLSNRLAVKAAILSFIRQQEALEILPKDAEVIGGNAKIVDIDTLNTNDTIAQGKFFIQYKQRIYSSMRFIVLRAEIGESVVVTEE